MASARFRTVESTSANGFVLILPVVGQKVKCIGPSALEVSIGSSEEEPAGTAHRPAITARLGHDVNARL